MMALRHDRCLMMPENGGLTCGYVPSNLLIQRCTHPAMAADGAATVASAILFLTIPGEREQATARITPIIHERGTGLAIIGRF